METNRIDSMVPHQSRVEKIIQETSDTFTLYLKLIDESFSFQFQAGQFNMIYVFGVGEVPISVSGDPEEPENLVHTIRAVGNVTQALRKVNKGDILGVRGPFGSSWPIKKCKGKDVIIVAGGIGLAPLRSAFYQLIRHRDDFGKISLLYGARTPDDILYWKELEEWRSRFDLQVRITVDHASTRWYGAVGVVPHLISKSRFDPENTLAMVCGPEVMIHYSVQELERNKVNKNDIYISMERNMKCAIGFCGHCQYGPKFICKDGPIFSYKEIEDLFVQREI